MVDYLGLGELVVEFERVLPRRIVVNFAVHWLH